MLFIKIERTIYHNLSFFPEVMASSGAGRGQSFLTGQLHGDSVVTKLAVAAGGVDI